MAKSLGELLKEMELITDEELKKALKIQRKKGGALGKILVDLGYISEEDVGFALAAQMGMDVVDLDEIEIPQEVLDMVDPTFVETYRVIPYMLEEGVLYVALADPMNINVLDDLHFMVNCKVQGAVATEEQVNRAIEKYYSSEEGESIEDILQEMRETEEEMALLEEKKVPDLADLESQANSTPVIKYLNLILLQGIKERAADIHIEPFEKELKIRMKIDGVLREMMSPPVHLSMAITSRVKVMSKLDIAETRLPQDGRIELTIGGRPVDLRVSTLPTMHGESTVMRILDKTNVNLDLECLGLKPNELKVFRALIAKPNGIVLVTGPTGSGKTTTLYSALSEANTIDTKIITTEDPVEYDLEGVIQVPVNEEIGVTYASCLRAILRQDPDKILVGEIRDKTTAQIAVEAALTGHLVLSTLHTNDAPLTIARMLDLGIEPFLVSATLEAVIAQRLVRKICTNCIEEYEPTDEELYELNLTKKDVMGKSFYRGAGCKTCNKMGYKGRQALYEILLINETLRNLILDEAPASQLRQAARENGMRTLRECGIAKIHEGITTIEEVVRETVFA
ncbi:MAG: pilus assembly protein PilB [Planctomycetota bacterium]|nr:MAG: pilus assembly protein PilB [Planctomycetota bacterium]